MTFSNKSIIITGSTGALGRVVARRFFDAGASIALPVRSASSARALVEEFAGAAHRTFVHECTLESEGSVRQFVDEVLKKFQRVDALANLAGGYMGGKPIAEVSVDEFERMLSTNLRTTFLMSRAVLAHMMKDGRGGRIVSMAAMPALTSGARKGPYALSKRGVIALTEIIADEVRGSGITANVIAPGIILTDDNRASMPDADTSKWVTPEELADVILFLCSDQARSINGTVIKMFGGL